MNTANTTPVENSFSALGVAPRLIQILNGLKFTTPTDIQYKAIPPAIEGKDIVGIAQTGTGKTLAFALPMIQRLEINKGMGLIVVPTRELAMQVEETFRTVGHSLGLKTALLIGGTSLYRQIEMIRRHPDVIIGTPGRINDHLNQKTLSLQTVNELVLDEADRMLDIGFLPQIRRILQLVPAQRQTMLFSATMPDEVFRLATTHMKLPIRIEIARSGTVAERVDQELFIVTKEQKNRLLEKVLHDYRGSVLIFCRTKFGTKRLCSAIRQMGFTAAEIHSNRTLGQRREALEGFKMGKCRILVATDIAARGIDVESIELVINYDLPEQPEDYVHRIGRTGRAGKSGRAISFAMPDQKHKVRAIEKLIRTILTVSSTPLLPAERAAAFVELPTRSFRPRRSFGGGGRRRF